MSDYIDLNAFRRLVCRFVAKLSDEERRNIVYIRLFQVREKYKNAEALDIFSKLETEGLFSPSKPEGLIEIARDVNRHDLASEVEKFVKSQRKSGSKEEKKGHKRPKSPPQAAAESVVDLHLKCNFEVTLTQATVLIKQVDIIERAITEGKGCRRKVEEAMKEARQTAERLAETLQKAQSELECDSGSDRSSGDLSPLNDETKDLETSRRMLPVPVQSLMASRDPAAPTPKPRRPRKCALEDLRAPVQDTGNSAQSTSSYEANTHLQASISGSPSVQKPTRWIKRPGLTNNLQAAPSTHSMERMSSPAVPPRNVSQRPPATTQLPSSRPPAKSPDVARRQRHTMFQHAAHSENEELEDSTAGTGDSGFSEAEQWKRYMQHPPPRPPIPDSGEQNHRYMSLIRSQMEAPYDAVQRQDWLISDAEREYKH